MRRPLIYQRLRRSAVGIAVFVFALAVGGMYFLGVESPFQREKAAVPFEDYERLAELSYQAPDLHSLWNVTNKSVPEEARDIMRRMGIRRLVRRGHLALCGKYSACMVHYRYIGEATEIKGEVIQVSRLGGVWALQE